MVHTAPRFPLEFQAVLRFTRGSDPSADRSELQARTQNMSQRGVCLELDTLDIPLPGADTLAELVLTLGESPEERKVHMTVRVVWCRDSRVGLEIRSIQGKGAPLFESLLQGYQTLFNFNPSAFPASRAA